jgi:hypothetical protein
VESTNGGKPRLLNELASEVARYQVTHLPISVFNSAASTIFPKENRSNQLDFPPPPASVLAQLRKNVGGVVPRFKNSGGRAGAPMRDQYEGESGPERAQLGIGCDRSTVVKSEISVYGNSA